MENQESSGNTEVKNPITAEDINMDDLIDIVDDGDGGREKSKTPEPYKPSLVNHRNFAYNILKYLEDKIVGNIEIQELECWEYNNQILMLPPKAVTILSCEHTFHRLCIEKNLIHNKTNICPLPDCRKIVDILELPSIVPSIVHRKRNKSKKKVIFKFLAKFLFHITNLQINTTNCMIGITKWTKLVNVDIKKKFKYW